MMTTDANMQDAQQLCEIWELLELVYTPQGRINFLTTPMQVFDGQTALALIKRGEFDRVYAELAGDYEGGGG